MIILVSLNHQRYFKKHISFLDTNCVQNGATGSRLISDTNIRKFHCAISSETALIFNSGYDANVGFSSIPQKEI
jgi:8-amino-7-oxononanoate synthase